MGVFDFLFGSGGGGGGSANIPAGASLWSSILGPAVYGSVLQQKPGLIDQIGFPSPSLKRQAEDIGKMDWAGPKAPTGSDFAKRMQGAGVGNATQQPYKPFQFTSQKLQPMAQKYYGDIENRGVEGIKQGTQAGMQQAAGLFGRRGMGRSGAAEQDMTRTAALSGRDIGNLRADVGFKRANEMQRISEGDLARDQSRQQLQAGENRAARQIDFEEQTMGRKLSMAERQQRMGEILSEYDVGARGRAESERPMDRLMQLVLASMGQQAPQTPGSQGLISGLGGLAQGAGDFMTGLGLL